MIAEAYEPSVQTLEIVRHLYAVKQRAVSTQEIEACSELSLSQVQDSLKRLLETGRITRPGRGMYIPVTLHPEPRAISQTLHPDGTCKIEIGDEVIALTPVEHRHLVRLLGGVMAEAAQMAAESVALQQIAVHGARIERADARLKKIEDFSRGKFSQLPLEIELQPGCDVSSSA
jgi:hypothetical protein